MSSAEDRVTALLALPPIFATGSSTLRGVATSLRNHDVGALVVADTDRLGIISERDVVVALANGADPDEVWAADVMTEGVLVARREDSISEVGRRMIDGNLRHMVVVDENARPVGVISLRDVAGALLRAAERI